MKKVLAFLFLLTVFNYCSPKAVENKKIFPNSKEVECVENIQGNSYKYLAWGIGATNQEAEDDALRAAIYACLITSGAGGCTAMLDIKEQEKSGEFLKQFFSDGTWSTFVVNTNRGRIDPGKRLKMDDGMIKLGVEVVVRIKELREFLVERKIIQKSPYGL